MIAKGAFAVGEHRVLLHRAGELVEGAQLADRVSPTTEPVVGETEQFPHRGGARRDLHEIAKRRECVAVALAVIGASRICQAELDAGDVAWGGSLAKLARNIERHLALALVSDRAGIWNDSPRHRGGTSLRGRALPSPIVGIAPSALGHGYYLAAADGRVYAFGRAFGGRGDVHLATPVVAIADRADLLTGLAPPGCRLRHCFMLDSAGFFASLANRLLLAAALPTARQIALWDRLLIPVSRLLDRLTGFRFGKTVVAVWQRR